MGRGSLAVLAGGLLLLLFSLLSGLSIFPYEITIWLPLLGLIIAAIIIGAAGHMKASHTVAITAVLYICCMTLLTFIFMAWMDVPLGPFELSAIYNAWAGFLIFIYNLLPPLAVFHYLAAIASSFFTETILQYLVYNLVVYSFFAILTLLVAGLSAHFSGVPSVHVVTAPVITEEPPFTSETPAVTTPPLPSPAPVTYAAEMPAAPSSQPAIPSTPPPSMPTPSPSSPPSMPAPSSAEVSMPKDASPTAKAMASVKGDPTKRLKKSGQIVPTGQTRCPHCQATVIRGSRFCNACEKEIL